MNLKYVKPLVEVCYFEGEVLLQLSAEGPGANTGTPDVGGNNSEKSPAKFFNFSESFDFNSSELNINEL